ncbi:MAG: EAL domain-containing protein, partial [Actinomycetota bacterium]|nr:EAL domain-containing protein [Actinomycetota bacterium]
MTSLIASPNRGARLLFFVAGVALAALLVFRVGVLGLEPPQPPLRLPWWILIVLFYATEMVVVHVNFRSEAHSFSISEIPLVFGFFFFDPALIVAAYVSGAAAALLIHRRQAAVRMALNVASFALQACVAVVVFHAIIDLGQPLAPRSWLAALAAALGALLVADQLISGAIQLSGGKLTLAEMAKITGVGAIATTMSASLGLIAVVIAWRTPGAAWMALVPPTILLVAYSAYGSQRQQRDRLESLYEATRELHRSPQLDTALVTAARHACDMLDAEVATIVLLTPGGASVTTTASPDDDSKTMQPGGPHSSDRVWAWIAAFPQPMRFDSGSERDKAGRFLPDVELRDGIIVPLRPEGELAGAMVVANRRDAGTFSEGDSLTLETLASHVSVSIQNGRLEDSLATVTELKEELRHQAFHDHLTGLANRMLFSERVAHALDRRRSHGDDLAVMLVDIDDFKTINDSLGHAAGDRVLVAVAGVLQECLRPGDTPARLGGDEFAVLLEDLAHVDDAVVVARRILEALSAPITVGGHQLLVSSSIGIATERDAHDVEAFMRNADVAMYAAKDRGKQGYALFEPGMHASTSARLELKADLVSALERNEFVVHYQPIIHLDTGEITGAEALVRWYHPRRGLVMPNDFISLAEESRQIIPIGRSVLNDACRQVARWQEQFGIPLSVAVNLSPVQLSDRNLTADVIEALEESGLDPSHLVIEITESMLMENPEAARESLSRLRVLGVRVSVDDFGTGYSSLSHLDAFPIDTLKIDRSFILRLGGEAGREKLTSAIIALSQSLRLATVAEGVENSGQLESLQAMGCESGQGFYLARPLPVHEMEY